MAQKKDALLDLNAYLAKARGGTTKDYRKKATVFSQGSPADAVFYIEKRLARILLMLTRFGKDGQHEPVVPRISQETLAEMVGTTRSRVSFFMNKFRRMGLIEYNGGLQVHSSLLNIVLHD